MFSRRLKRLTPYTAGEQPQDRRYIKLNTNENPYPPSPAVRDFLRDFDIDRLKRYPDPQALELRGAIAERYGVAADQVFVANGSDELLSFIFYAFFDGEDGNLLFPDYTYSFYPVYCDFYGIPYHTIPLSPDFTVDLKAFASQERSSGIIFPNPNAPTGIAVPIGEIQTLLDTYRGRVVAIDEAYVDFGSDSALSFLSSHENLIIVRTLSKSMSLAGLRLGFSIQSRELTRCLFMVKDSFNSYPVDTLAQKIATLAFHDREYYDRINGMVVKTRKNFAEALSSEGWEVLPSMANFVFARKPGTTGEHIYQNLKERGILVRHFKKGRIIDFLRITIGTDEEMETFLKEAKRL
jgi:histidinol-phosphate aminotransferase